MHIEEIRECCLALPGATEDVKWGADLVFSVGGKMFCVVGMEQPLSFSFKATEEIFAELTQKNGFIPAPYLARYQWVLVQEATTLPLNQGQEYIQTSYEIVKTKLPKKVLKEAGLL